MADQGREVGVYIRPGKSIHYYGGSRWRGFCFLDLHGIYDGRRYLHPVLMGPVVSAPIPVLGLCW